jgi:hypothetical protein
MLKKKDISSGSEKVAEHLLAPSHAFYTMIAKACRSIYPESSWCQERPQKIGPRDHYPNLIESD